VPDTTRVIDLIYRQDGGRRPEVIVSDTGSYSDIVFGLLRLLGFDYRPQLADLPDAKLWRIDPRANYGPLETAADVVFFEGEGEVAVPAGRWSRVATLHALPHGIGYG